MTEVILEESLHLSKSWQQVMQQSILSTEKNETVLNLKE